MKQISIWHISDTHNHEKQLVVPEGVTMVIFSGDCSNFRDPYKNEPETREFLTWFSALNITHKIMIAGNHDSSIERGLVDRKTIEDLGIIYLENECVTVEGFKIFGSPYTPTFGQWCFMKSRDKINRVWDSIDDDTDIVVTHGPPKGVLDLTRNRDNSLEMCGCNALTKRMNALRPKAVLFGHIHNCKGVINAGVLERDGVIYSNGSVVTDGKFGEVSSNGNILQLSQD